MDCVARGGFLGEYSAKEPKHRDSITPHRTNVLLSFIYSEWTHIMKCPNKMSLTRMSVGAAVANEWDEFYAGARE